MNFYIRTKHAFKYQLKTETIHPLNILHYNLIIIYEIIYNNSYLSLFVFFKATILHLKNSIYNFI